MFPIMKVSAACLLVMFASLFPAFAQMDIPGNPMVKPKTGGRTAGGTVDPGVTITPGAGNGNLVKHVTHVILHAPRVWTNTSGKTIQAPLIAFEDLEVTAAKGGPVPKMPAAPEKPTLMKAGKIRLLVNQKPAEVALDTLVAEDKVFVEKLSQAIAAKSASKIQ